MQAGQLTIANPHIGNMTESSAIGKVGSWMARVFGCWHTQMSRPFSHRGQAAYRVCLSCGAQRKFDLGSWEMKGNYYYHRPTKHFASFGLTAVRRISN